MTIFCNSHEGYHVYAVGQDAAGNEGHTDLVGTNPNNIIKAGTNTSGETSSWFFKLGSPSTDLAITPGFTENHTIPETRTIVASRSSGPSTEGGDSFDVSYFAYTSSSQKPGTYTGQVKYLLVQQADSQPLTMQNWSGCSSLSKGQIITLTDNRDGNEYRVAKLEDGRCWMVDNLKLGGSDLKNRTLTPTDSDVKANFVLPADDSSAFVVNDVWDADKDNSAVHVDEVYGGYYTWQTATAGTGSSVSNGNAPGSICPKGWRLPTGDSGGEFEALNNAYGGITDSSAHLIATPLPGFLANGYIGVGNGNIYDQTSYGHYWSSTALGAASAYILQFDRSSVSPMGNSYRPAGFSVRCIKDSA